MVKKLRKLFKKLIELCNELLLQTSIMATDIKIKAVSSSKSNVVHEMKKMIKKPFIAKHNASN